MLLKGVSVILSPIEEQDIDYIHSFTSDYEKISPIFCTHIRSKIYWKKKFQDTGSWDDDFGMLKMIDKKNKNLFGVIWFFKGIPYADGYEIGFNIFNNLNKNKKIIEDGLIIFSSYLFETFNINRLCCNTHHDMSESSKKSFAERTGYVFEGKMRKAIFIRGRLKDYYLYSILREESMSLNDALKI